VIALPSIRTSVARPRSYALVRAPRSGAACFTSASLVCDASRGCRVGVVEGQQLVSVVGDLRGGLGELRAVGGAERLDRGQGVGLVLGAPDLREGLLRDRVGGLGQRGQDVGGLVEPAPALPGGVTTQISTGTAGYAGRLLRI